MLYTPDSSHVTEISNRSEPTLRSLVHKHRKYVVAGSEKQESYLCDTPRRRRAVLKGANMTKGAKELPHEIFENINVSVLRRGSILFITSAQFPTYTQNSLDFRQGAGTSRFLFFWGGTTLHLSSAFTFRLYFHFSPLPSTVFSCFLHLQIILYVVQLILPPFLRFFFIMANVYFSVNLRSYTFVYILCLQTAATVTNPLMYDNN